MPQSQRSLRLTDAYRRRLFSLRDQLQARAETTWPDLDGIDAWPAQMAQAVEVSQTAALRLTAAYLTSFATSETGKAQKPVAVESTAGKGADGSPLAESMRSPLIGAFAALKEGKGEREALRIGLDRAKRQVGMDFDAAHRTGLMEAIHADDRFDGWNRALRGTCGACAASASGLTHALWFPAHPGCQCVAEPRVTGTRDLFARATGLAIFHAKTQSEQDEMLGAETAARVRSGEIQLGDLVAHSELDSDQPNFITQRPLKDVPTNA